MLLFSLPIVLPFGAIPAVIILFLGIASAIVSLLGKYDIMSGIEGTVLTITATVVTLLIAGSLLVRFG